MTFDSDAPGRCVLHIAGGMTRDRASELKQELLGTLSQNSSVDIDLQGVSEIDAAGLQLLIAARKYAVQAGKDLRFVQHNAPVLEALTLAGLETCLGAGTAHCPDCERTDCRTSTGAGQ